MKNWRNKLAGLMAMAVLAVTVLVQGTVPVLAETTDEFERYASTPIIFDIEYIEEALSSHLYLIRVPAKGTVTITSSLAGGQDPEKVDIENIGAYDPYHIESGNKTVSESTEWTVDKKAGTKSGTVVLEKGDYYMEVVSSGSWYDDPKLSAEGTAVSFTVSYRPSVPSAVKLSSSKKGTITVKTSAADAGTVQVRYKKAGEKKWTVKSVSSSSLVKYNIRGLKSGKYTVQIRQAVRDSYGYTSYSKWTSAKTVKIK